MSKKQFIVVGTIIFCLILIVAAIGLSKRDTHKNPFESEESINNLNVSMLRNDQLSIFEGSLKDTIINDSIIVLKVVPLEEPKFDFQATTQKVKVEEIFKGEGVNVGDEILITLMSWHYFNEKESMNLFFVNFMKIGDEYMIFIDEKIETEIYEDVIYQIGGFAITPVFNYKNVENKVIETTLDEPFVKYGEVRDNEFFCSNEETLAALKKFKYEMMSQFDLTVEPFN